MSDLRWRQSVYQGDLSLVIAAHDRVVIECERDARRFVVRLPHGVDAQALGRWPGEPVGSCCPGACRRSFRVRLLLEVPEEDR